MNSRQGRSRGSEPNAQYRLHMYVNKTPSSTIVSALHHEQPLGPRTGSRGNKLKLTILVLASLMGTASLRAQDAWQIDPQQSVASISLGSGQNTLQTGVGRVRGEVVFDSNDPADPSINLAITGGKTGAGDDASINFSSQQSWITADGKLMAKGKLTITRSTRPVISADANEAYSGPVYEPPVSYTSSHWMTIMFSDPRHAFSQDARRELTASISGSREGFPELLDAAVHADWPRQLVNDEKCTTPATDIEDYSGQICTGAVIAKVTNALVPIGTPGGEDFSGFGPAVSPDRNHVTIVLAFTVEKTPTSSAIRH